jgi:hypothetical protein
VFHFYLFPFVFLHLDWFSHLLFGCIPYLPLIINTLMCSYISRYFVGNITRKAVNSLLSGRALSLLLKAFLVYVIYLVLFRLSTPENIGRLASQFGAKAHAASGAAGHQEQPTHGAGGGVSLWIGLPA